VRERLAVAKEKVKSKKEKERPLRVGLLRGAAVSDLVAIYRPFFDY